MQWRGCICSRDVNGRYRLEPLIDGGLAQIDPLEVPTYNGKQPTHVKLKNAATAVQGGISWAKNGARALFSRKRGSPPSTADTSAREHTAAPVTIKEEPRSYGMLNGGNRIDRQLVLDTDVAMAQYLRALQSHRWYWKSRDFAAFIAQQLLVSPTDV